MGDDFFSRGLASLDDLPILLEEDLHPIIKDKAGSFKEAIGELLEVVVDPAMKLIDMLESFFLKNNRCLLASNASGAVHEDFLVLDDIVFFFFHLILEFTKEATAIDLLFLDNAVNKAKEKYKLAMPLKKEELPKFLEDKYDNPLWTELAKKCFSCGKCNLVCPTCVCFNIEDKAELNLQEGVREREWHGCALKEFAEVAMGHNFRGKIEQRLRHRIYRKLSYTVSRYGIYGCVGCGRCINSCKAGIASPVEIIKKLNKE